MNGTGERDVVLVTGFGAFGIHDVNASWEAVCALPDICRNDKFQLVTEQLPVVYAKVDQRVPALWRRHAPKLVVHCGVSGIAKEVTMEQAAHRTGYLTRDNDKCCPAKHACAASGPDVIESKLSMSRVTETVNKQQLRLTAVKSQDAGNFLCDYTYYKSLSIDPDRCAFIHVPTITENCTPEALAEVIRHSILNMLEQLDDARYGGECNGIDNT